MARLVSWPVGLKANAREPLAGPRAISGGSTTSIGNFTQTFASPFGLWRWRFSFPPMRGQMARRYRGWITSLHGGANATRVSFCDWDGLTPSDAGVQGKTWNPGLPWSNGQPWGNGQPWQGSPPVVAVAASTARDDTTVKLDSAFWGGVLDVGDQIGFFPFHFGMYMITERIAAGEYRVWPPLQKSVTTSDYATLEPVLAMRLESEDAATANRDAAFISNAQVTLVEVLDYDARGYFAD